MSPAGFDLGCNSCHVTIHPKGTRGRVKCEYHCTSDTLWNAPDTLILLNTKEFTVHVPFIYHVQLLFCEIFCLALASHYGCARALYVVLCTVVLHHGPAETTFHSSVYKLYKYEILY